jgi:hypothetical protein
MPKDTHSTLPVDAELVLPEQVTVALAELAGAAHEGLLALAVGTGLGCWGACWTLTSSGWLAPKAVTILIGPRSVTAPSPARSPSAAGASGSTGHGSAPRGSSG